VSRALLGFLPDPLDGVEVGRAGRQPVQFDSMAVGLQPRDTISLQVVAGTVVDDEEEFASCRTDELLQECKERAAVEHGRKHVVEARAAFQRHRTEYVRGGQDNQSRIKGSNRPEAT